MAEIFGAAVFAILGAVATSSLPAGVVVEKVVPGHEAAKAGIQPGDVLVSWEREANPPANPAGASGSFRSPFDVDEVRFEQGPRVSRLILGLLRAGTKTSTRIGQYPWRLEIRPAFSAKWLPRYEEGRRLVEEGDSEKGSDLWRTLARDLSAANRHVEAAWLWSRVGMKQSEARQPDAALVALGEGLKEARLTGQPEIEGQLWGLEVEVLRAANRQKEAQDPARKAIAVRERISSDGLPLSVALYELTTVIPDDAPEYGPLSRRILEIRGRLAPGSRFEADVLTNLSRFAENRGDSRGAIDLQQRALAIHRGLDPNGRSVARACSTLCAYQMNRGDLASAEDSCRRALDLARALGPGDRGLVVQVLHNLGVVARLRGDFDRAVQLFLQALEIDATSRMAGYNNFEIGVTEVSRRDVEKLDLAEQYVRRADQIIGDDPRHIALSALIRADIAYQRKDLAGAEMLLRQSLAYYERTAPESPAGITVLECLGHVLGERGQVKEAEERLRRSLAVRQRTGPGSQESAQTYYDLGMLLWRTGRVVEAEAALRSALEDLESQIEKLGGSDEDSSSFSAQYADFYKDYLQLLMELRREQDAFLVLERFRAGAFRRTLAQRELALPEDVPPDLDRERRLTNEAYERGQAEIRQLNPSADATRIDEGLARLAELRVKQAEIAERIRKASPKYGELQYPQALDLAAARSALDPGTLLLSYSVGKSKSFLFVVSSDPKRGPPLSVLALPVGDKALRDLVGAFRRMIDRKKPSGDLVPPSRALYDLLLKPAEPLIGKCDRLQIVPDGPLHTLPWAALVRTGRVERPEYLVEWKPVSTVVSATVYAQLKKTRPEGRMSPAIEVAAFGDPRYPAFASRKAAVTRGDGVEEPEETLGDDLELGAVLRGGYRFESLPRSRQEVETIASLYAPRSEAFVGDQATEKRAISIGRNVPLIHYACHAYVNERYPLDSALVFTIPEKPQPGQDNGLLQAWEIFEKVRIDADLVTLSACDTGLGKEMGGEGLIGLTRAFQYAGARSVLASLWKVEDESTGDLMKRFYGYLKAGKTKDEALRLAQIDLIRSPRYSQPRDWAAFELMGDWK